MIFVKSHQGELFNLKKKKHFLSNYSAGLSISSLIFTNYAYNNYAINDINLA